MENILLTCIILSTHDGYKTWAIGKHNNINIIHGYIL